MTWTLHTTVRRGSRAAALCGGMLVGAAAAAAALWVLSLTPEGFEWLLPRLCSGVQRLYGRA